MAEQTSQQSSRTLDVFGRKVDANKLVLLLSDRDAFDSYYRNKKISDSEREDTWRSLNILRKHLADGTGGLQVVIDKDGNEGIDNTAGMHNLDNKGRVTKGADAYATAYFLRLAKGMDAYEEPKKETNNSKIKYSDLAIGTALNRYFYGRDNGDIRDFLDLDRYDETKKTRPTTNRAALFRKGLEHIKNNWDSLFEGWTEDLKTLALKNIEDAFTVFDNDHVITDNEYLTLGKATGMSNLRKMFTNGQVAQQDGSSADLASPKQRTYGDKIRWIERNYKPYTGKLRSPLSIAVPSTEVYEDAAANIVTNGFQNASNDELYSLIREGLTGADLNNSTLMKKLFPKTNPRMSSHYLVNAALQLLKSRTDGLYNFGESNLGMYYIPTTKTEKNTGIAWNSNDNTLNEMSIHQIPYWVLRINNEWEALGNGYEENLNPILTAIYKSGGVIKAKLGTVMDRLGVPDMDNWLNIDNTYTNALDTKTWKNYYDNDGIDEDIRHSLLRFNSGMLLERPDPRDKANPLDITSFLRTPHLYRPSITGPWTRGYLRDKDGNIIKGDDGKTKYGLSGALLGILLNKLEQIGSNLSWNKKLDDTGYDQWNSVFDLTGFNKYFGSDENRFDYMGPSTYNRHALLDRMKRIYNKENPLSIDKDKIYWNGRRWELMMDPTKLKNTDLGKSGTISPDKLPTPKPAPKVTLKDRLAGTDPDDKGKGIDWDRIGLYAKDYIPEAINTAMLFDSLRSNRRIKDLLDESAHVDLMKNWQHAITGAFGEKQSLYSQAALTNNLGDRMAKSISDAEKGFAAMLEANELANALKSKGDLIDNNEIKRNSWIAEQMANKTMENHIDVANANSKSIHETNIRNRQNEAKRILADQKSRANFGKAMLNLYWYRDALKRDLLDKEYLFNKDIALLQSNLLNREAQEKFNTAYNTWLERTDSAGKLINKGKPVSQFLNTPEGIKAQSWLDQATDMNLARMNSLKSSIYKYDYEDPYKGEYKINYSKMGSKLILRKKK